MFKVARLNPIASIGTDLFTGKYEMTENLAEASAVLVRSASMHELELPDGLLAIARAGAGVNNIPLDECAKKGIVVFNAPGANANGVKEMVLAGMLLAARDIYGGITWIRENKDEADIAKLAEKAKKNFAGTEIQGKTLGVIGLGAIGALVANASLNLGMHVMGYDPYISVEGAWSLDHHVQRVNNLDDIYANCDYITIHVPAMDGTIGMIDEAAIAKMKDGVVFLNFASDGSRSGIRKSSSLCIGFRKSGKREYEERDHPSSSGGFHGGVGRQLCCNGSQRADELSGSWKYRKFREFPPH